MRITLRLTDAEAEHLALMADSDTTGTENRSEFIRLLLAREWNRRKGLPKPVFNSIATASRSGRPKVSDIKKPVDQPDNFDPQNDKQFYERLNRVAPEKKMSDARDQPEKTV